MVALTVDRWYDEAAALCQALYESALQIVSVLPPEIQNKVMI